MELIKKQVPYQLSKDCAAEYGDLNKAVPEELYDNTILDCVIIRCHQCRKIIPDDSEIYDLRLNEKNGCCICSAYAKKLSNI
ncbi:MAG: hypothetical protein K5705_00315 [Oscillospiraceae bacterium]|nr:hypothetical protein [Oscillospiraceae bacterium]